MEVDKENWHPKTKTSKRHNLSRRRSTGIMKGGDSTGDLISPKAKKRSRIEMMNKRVSFGVVDVRLYEKDIDWTASPTEKKTARSVDVGSIPFNDGSPIATAPNSDKSMLRALCDDDDDDDDNEEQTMEMTVNHGRIIAQALSEKTNLSTLLDDDQSEGPGSPLTMDLTMNYSKIMQNKQENEDTMEMTVNHSKIVSADPVIIKVITSPSPESSQKCEGTKLETAVSPFEAGQKPCRRFLPSPKEGICFSISTPPDALKATPNDIDEFDLISPSHQSFIDNDQTSDLTRNIQHHIGSIVAGDDDDKTVELNRLTSQMTEHEAKVAMEFKRILNSDIEGDSTTNITVQLDSVDEFLSNIRSPEVASTAVEKPLKEPTKVEISPIRHPVINSVDAFLSYGRIRFMDATNSTRKTLSVGFAPTNEPASEPERLHFACYHLPTLTNVQDSANQLSKICSTLSAEIKEMEDWLDSQAPDVFVKYLQKGDEKLFENLQQLKQACKLQSKIKWYQHRFRQEESLLAALKERTQQLRSDKKFIVEADTQIRDIMQQQRLNDGKLSVLRTAIEDQASKIDELNNDLEHLQKSESSLSSNLQNLQLAVQKQESLASKKELWRKDEVSLVAKSRDLFFLQACVDWRMSKCSETDLVLSFGSLCSITFQISGNGTGNILSAKFVRQTSGSEIWASLIKANEPKFNSILQQAGQVRQLPPLLKKFSLWLGRMRSLEMEIHKLMPIYTILVEPSPNDFLLNITICSSSPISSVTFTVQLDVEKFATNPVSLIEIRLLHGPDNLGQHIRDIIASAQGFGSLSKICSEVSSRLSMQPSVCA